MNIKKKRTIILGVNNRIGDLVSLLKEENISILVISRYVEQFSNELKDVETLKGDFLNKTMLAQADISNSDSVIILAETIGNSNADVDARSVVATLTVESIHPDTRTVVEVLSKETAHHLRKANVDEIIESGKMTADMLAFSTTHSDYSNHLAILLRFAHKNRIILGNVNENVLNKTLSKVSTMYAKDRKIILGVRIDGNLHKETLSPKYVIQKNDVLVYIDMP
tara:strand:+ start:50 stop:721 length:672 start_codon:yes stop_codon:yes gene_type:complete